MSGHLKSAFEKRFPGGAAITARLDVPAGAFSITVLFGPSGCGKTTVLRSLAGLERPESGTIHFQGETWLDAERKICRPPRQRDVGFGFQEYALFPHLTIGRNIGYGFRGTVEARRRAVGEMLERFRLAGLENRYPHQVSGGQQQRAALARVLVRRPRLLLLDEPLSALDAALRDELRMELRRLLRDFGVPVVLVTHDRVEAISLADRVVVMNAGRVEQAGSVEEVFSRPINSTVAGIVGIETVELGEVVAVGDGLATVDIRGVRLQAVAPAPPSRRVHVCIQGEAVTLHRGEINARSGHNQLASVVHWITPEGPLMRVGLDSGGMELTCLVPRLVCEELRLRVGERLTASVKAASIHLIPLHEGGRGDSPC